MQYELKVPHIYCFIPHFALWGKRFSDWTNEDWNDQENISVLYEMDGDRSGDVRWARGCHDLEKMRDIGVPISEFLQTGTPKGIRDI